jgi:hypothetical protein
MRSARCPRDWSWPSWWKRVAFGRRRSPGSAPAPALLDRAVHPPDLAAPRPPLGRPSGERSPGPFPGPHGSTGGWARPARARCRSPRRSRRSASAGIRPCCGSSAARRTGRRGRQERCGPGRERPRACAAGTPLRCARQPSRRVGSPRTRSCGRCRRGGRARPRRSAPRRCRHARRRPARRRARTDGALDGAPPELPGLRPVAPPRPAIGRSRALEGSDATRSASAAGSWAAGREGDHPAASSVWRRKATITASSASVRTVERGSPGPDFGSSTVARLRHFATVPGSMPSPRLGRARGLRPPCRRSDGVRGRGAPATHPSRGASFRSRERITPPNRGIEQLGSASVSCCRP